MYLVLRVFEVFCFSFQKWTDLATSNDMYANVFEQTTN